MKLKNKNFWMLDGRATRISSGYYNTPEIEMLLKSKDYSFILGKKGFGKSFQINLKSFNARENDKNSRFHPRNELSSNLSMVIPFNKIKCSNWRMCYKASFLATVLHELEDETIKKDYGDVHDLVGFLNINISQGYYQLYKRTIEKAHKKLSSFRQTIEIYVDNFDYMVYSFLDRYDDSNPTYWEISAQLKSIIEGYIDAIIEINHTFRNKVRIISTIDESIIKFVSNKTRYKLLSECHIVEYTVEQIQGMFEWQLNQMDGNYDYYFNQSFFKHKKIKYSSVLNESESYFDESPFEYILRHTRGSPRELFFYGKNLVAASNQSLKNSSLDFDQIVFFKKVISETSKELLKYIIAENEPFIINDEVYNYLGKLNSNIIELSDAFKDFELLTKLFQIGLIGYLIETTNESIQAFNQYSEDSIFTKNLPLSKLYLLHPILNANLAEKCRLYPNIMDKAGFKHELYRFDIAFSFAGEDRNIVEQIIESLGETSLSIFYDKFFEVELWGKDLYQYLSDVYKNKAKYCIILISENYEKKLWTKHELRNAQERAFLESKEYILPLRLDNTVLPGLNSTTGYMEWSNTTPEKIAQIIKEKVNTLPNKW